MEVGTEARGPATRSPDASNVAPAIQVRLLRDMLRIRVIEQTIADVYSQQEMRCPVHLSIGQEAAAVGVCGALLRSDYALSGHRCHGHYLAKGGDLKAMLAEMYGKVTGCCQGKGGSMHLVDLSAGFMGAAPIVGSTIPIAVGTAFGSMMRDDPRVAVTFFGDGAAETGVLHESLSFASLKRLPVLFVCENNLYSVLTPLTARQPSNRSLTELAAGHGVASHNADGNDVLAVYACAVEAVKRARAGDGPTFLELTTYRWLEHCGPLEDYALGYRSLAEVNEWKSRDPIMRFERQLVQNGLVSSSEIESLRGELKAEVDEAIRYAKESPFPGQELLQRDVYDESVATARL